mmetsp:Transcript_12107/g.34031  ORF Transcript_12107/g.34031 Transcript_12107/m.34031 type:complete len:211 (+) Transcript_12107:74-706(+)
MVWRKGKVESREGMHGGHNNSHACRLVELSPPPLAEQFCPRRRMGVLAFRLTDELACRVERRERKALMGSHSRGPVPRLPCQVCLASATGSALRPAGGAGYGRPLPLRQADHEGGGAAGGLPGARGGGGPAALNAAGCSLELRGELQDQAPRFHGDGVVIARAIIEHGVARDQVQVELNRSGAPVPAVLKPGGDVAQAKRQRHFTVVEDP